jgi:hypothetical protein
MVESPAQFGRLKTLIHPGPVAGVHVNGMLTEPTEAVPRPRCSMLMVLGQFPQNRE